MGPLHGIKILEFSGIGPGPYCGMLLADLGADVIRLSRINQKGSYNKYDIHNRSKRSIVADLKNPKTLEEIKKLIQQMDVIFEGYRPGVMEKLGLGGVRVSKRGEWEAGMRGLGMPGYMRQSEVYRWQ